MRQPASVVCAGILVADLFVPPLERLPGAGELIATEDFLLQPGGCAANTAIALAKLGVPVSVSGKVGNDIFGDAVAHELQANGVQTDALKRSASYNTSKTVILPVVGEDRRYIHTIGANADFRVDDIDLALAGQAQVFALGGYFVLPKLESLRLIELLAGLKKRGVRTVLDIVVPTSTHHPTLDDLRPILPHIDVFMPDSMEATMLTGETDPEKQAELFLQAGCAIAIITRGRDGALLMSAQKTLEAPAFPVEVVDVSGAGDAFAAGFIVGLLEQWQTEDALRFASVIGASACTKLGCTGGVFTRKEAETYIQTHPLPIVSHKTS
jgi:sugar/nucleoside kinase (ribokinase family)